MIPLLKKLAGSQCPSVGRALEAGASEQGGRQAVGGGPSGCPGVQLLPISIKNVGREEGGEEGGLVGDQ